MQKTRTAPQSIFFAGIVSVFVFFYKKKKNNNMETSYCNYARPSVWSGPVIRPVSVRSAKFTTQMVTNGKREKLN